MKTIAIASGKGGTGKTFVATNLAVTMDQLNQQVTYIDCDVEAPNGHLFLKPKIDLKKDVILKSPLEVDPKKCNYCGKCAENCQFNAIAVFQDNVLFFPELCHLCGACSLVCPTAAIIKKDRTIGVYKEGYAGNIKFKYSLLKTGEGGMSPRLIKNLKKNFDDGINIIDSPPGTACPAVESIRGVDLVVLVTDPTPFGIHDLKLSVDMCRKIGQEPVIIINRSENMGDDLQNYCQEEKLKIIGEIPDKKRIARIYSKGDILVQVSKRYHLLFERITQNLLRVLKEERELKKPRNILNKKPSEKLTTPKPLASKQNIIYNELVVISGKGGTGKTSLTASFCHLAENLVLSDCDVDAADLHIITQPKIKDRGFFSGGAVAQIDQIKCTQCGICLRECQFDAIRKEREKDKELIKVDELACEGCGVCAIVCPENAIKLETTINGEWFVSDTRFGPMSHAQLGIAEENSGKLVTLVREKAVEILSEKKERDKILMDGAPGTGCPVIASLTGVNYALIVTEPTVSGIHDLKRILDVTLHFGIESGIVINKYNLNLKKTREIKKIASLRKVRIIGKIPYDKAFTKAQVKGLSIVEYTSNSTTKSVKNIWKEIKREINPNKGEKK